MNKRNGLIHIYTGNGKGKTTAALGLAMRASSSNLRVCFIYFHKQQKLLRKSEVINLKKIGVDVLYFAQGHPAFDKKVKAADARKLCLNGIAQVKKIFQKNIYDVIILDEILISSRDGFLKVDEVIEIMQLKPKKTELILTGRGAAKKIISKADLVSEIKNLKHPYQLKCKARKGIDF